MTPAIERLRARVAQRAAWIAAATAGFADDPSVVAAWLWGSEGRGDADALSDFDLFVALDGDAGSIDTVDERFAQFGETLWVREVPYNAPAEGRYFSVGYAAALVPLGIDWYWQPASAAQIGADTRVLVEKVPLPRSDLQTFRLFPNVANEVAYRHPDDATERLQGLLVWFWSMFGSLGKQAARGREEQVVEQVPLLEGVLALAADHVGEPQPELREAAPLRRLRELADRMQAMHPRLRVAGIEVPDTTQAFEWLALAEDLRAEGWRPDRR